MESLENHLKNPCMEKSGNLKKPEYSLKNHRILWNDLTKSPVARKLAVRHLCVRQLVFWLLVVSSFNYFKMHAWSTSMLLLLHSAFMLSTVKMLLKGEVGGCALNSHGITLFIMKNHGIVLELWTNVSQRLKYFQLQRYLKSCGVAGLAMLIVMITSHKIHSQIMIY